jgi:hypothetical protein
MQPLQFSLRLHRIQRLIVDGDQASDSTLAGFDNFLGGIGVSGFLPQQIPRWGAMTIGTLQFIFDRSLHQRVRIGFCKVPR